MANNKELEALKYHEAGKPGKLEVIPTKILSSQRDLALAYSPGVAVPCLEIAENPENVYRYTAKGNLVAVITNGTAVLGLGNIGALASKPVMEGKAVLFKKFAGIDVFDIELDIADPDEFIRTVKALEPTFGGVNLEDIKAPESFRIEQELIEKLNIPIMHDDQHGTAIISGAALLNALEVVGKNIGDIRLVVNGAGAAAISCTRLYVKLGVKKENIIMLDSKGVINKYREDLNDEKKEFLSETKASTLAEAMEGADVFVGLSVGNVVSPEMLLSMTENPIVFALANPDPEIPYDVAIATRKDVVMATGRSDHPNQVNNVLGFPFIFRGALDVRANRINDEMKLATVYALAEMAKEPVPEMVSKAYGSQPIKFGREYLIPKPLDSRLITRIAPAVAKAAIESGVAKHPILDWDAYKHELEMRIGMDTKMISRIFAQAKKDPKRVVFPEADNAKILQAAQILVEEGICKPILLGKKSKIEAMMKDLNLDFVPYAIIDPSEEKEKRKEYGACFYEKRKRKGMTQEEARKRMAVRNYYGAVMVEKGDADALISGLTRDYPSTVKPLMEVIGTEKGIKRAAGMYIMLTKKGPYFFSDTVLNINPEVEDLVDITQLTERAVRFFNEEPRIAMLSYSNFGSGKGDGPSKVARATKEIKQRFPHFKIDGEMQANIALNPDLQKELYPFSEIAAEGANTLIFPNLESGNIAYKLIMEMGAAEALGPILLGMNKPVHVLQIGSSIRDIVNMTSIAVVDAQEHLTKKL